MSFKINSKLEKYEFRCLISDSFRDRETNQSIPYMTMVVENGPRCEQSRISVPKDIWEQVEDLGIEKGEYVDLLVTVSGGSNYSKLSLVEVLHVYDENGEVDF